jgi:anti-sigma factor RsiW
MKCSEAVELMSLLVDGRATAQQESMLRFHLNGCAGCRRTMAAFTAISRAVASLPDPEPPRNLEAAVMARLRDDDYDRSPLERPFRFPLLHRAAILLPFAATLILAARVFMPSPAPEPTEIRAMESFTPMPPSAYTRPVTLTTF